MALWKVVADHIKLFPHPNSDRLLVGKVGKFQVVVSKENGYKDGDLVVFAPERSVLPEEIRGEYVNTDTGISYLHGEKQDRVGAVRLRGELSEGATLPLDWVRRKLKQPCDCDWVCVCGSPVDIPVGMDLSEALGITKYIPTIPEELKGKVSHMNETEFETRFHKHDVEMFRMFGEEFVPGELVDLTEKVNGSQVNVMRSLTGDVTLTSKYLGQEGFIIDRDLDNKYWAAVHNSTIESILNSFNEHSVQVVAEMIPCHKGFNYGQPKPTLRIFKLVIDGEEIPVSRIFNDDYWADFRKLWVPYLGQVKFDPNVFQGFADGKEQVSGKELHIREGIVITPAVPRNNSEFRSLAVKWLNTKYKGGTEDFA